MSHAKRALGPLLVLAMAAAAGCGNGAAPGPGAGPGGASGSGGANSGQGAGSSGGSGATGAGSSGASGSDAGSTATGGGTGGSSGSSAGASGGGDASASGADATSGAGRDGGAGGTAGSGADGSTGAGGTTADAFAVFHNGGFWNDTSGKRIEAHGAGIIFSGNTWYWIGEDKSQNSNLFNGVNCYSSTDLVTWKFENAIITQNTAPDLATAGRIIERPKVVYNDTTKQFVMWVHFDGNNYAVAEAGVFTSDTVCGDYTFQSAFQPNGNMSRDSTLFKDDDGKAYFISAANNNKDLGLYQLTADYLKVDHQVATLFAGSSREAPAMFKVNGRYFLLSSAATGWDPNQQKYASATAIGGPYSALANVGDATAFDTQTAYVIPYVGSQKTTYIYAGDRWMDPDLVSSKYIWLPLTVNGTTLSMDNHDTWTLDLTTGAWSAAGGNFVPQAGWKLLKADSEETQAEDGHATNAFDGSSSTIWHTQYTGTTPAHPHEIQIDLGAAYAVSGFQYLPRQDKDDHGMVADYQFYVSQDPTNWGTPVATGTFGTSRTATTVPFPATTARYVRFVALSEINGQPWTSVAELNLVPAP